MKQGFLTMLAISAVNLYVFAQELPEIIPPSPTVANLMQFEEVPISYYTGQPDITIPLYSKALNKDMTMNIGLSYNTQGVKVDNISGWTGTGWSLNAGGSISRVVQGEPDERNFANSSKNIKGIYHIDEYWDYFNLSIEDRTEFNFLALRGGKYPDESKYDTKPDLYQFNFMGYSGRFVVLKEGLNLVAKFLDFSGQGTFKVDITYDSQYVISAFQITDPKGYIYTFNVVEVSAITSISVSTTQGEAQSTISDSEHIANTAWHLSNVKLGNDVDLLSISYQNATETYQTAFTVTTNDILEFEGGISYPSYLMHPYNQNILEPVEVISYQNIYVVTKKVHTVTFLKDNTQIVFGLDGNYSHPETNGSILKSVTIKNGDSINKVFNLNYQDTIGSTVGSSTLERLWLTNIRETAGNTNLDYNLTYTNKEGLPYRNTNLGEEDSWGYFSGIEMIENICDNTYFSDDTIQTGLLKSIEYPTGGIKEFEFEHNAFSYYQLYQITFSDYIKNPRNVDIEHIFRSFDHTYTTSSNSKVITILDLDFEQDINIGSSLTASLGGDLSDHFIRIYNTEGYSKVITSLNMSCVVIKNIPAGTYRVELERYVGNQNTYQVTGDVTITKSNSTLNQRQEMIGGGVRIKAIKFKDNPSAISSHKHIKFKYDDENDSDYSSGVIDSWADRLKMRYSKTLIRGLFGFNEEGSCHSLMPREVTYSVEQKQVNTGVTKGGYIGYRHVTVLEEGNGYKTFNYTSPYEYPSPSHSTEFNQPAPMPNLDYKRGLLLDEKIYDNSGKILKEINYRDLNGFPNYDFVESPVYTDLNHYLPNDCLQMQFIQVYNDYINGFVATHPCSSDYTPGALGFSPCGDLNPKFTVINSGWAKLKGTTTKEYFYDSFNNQTIKQNLQEFNYNTSNYQVSQEDVTYLEKGLEEHFRTKYFYPVNASVNSTTAAVKTKMVDLNIINTILESKTFKVTGQGVNEVEIALSETHNVHQEFSTNLVKPSEIKTLKGANLVESRILFNRYDIMGNVLEVSKTEGSKISYIWGHNKTKPVAQILNASFDDVELLLGNDFSPIDNLLQSHVNTLYNSLPNAQVTTFTYDPLVGVTSITDPRGYTSYFEYDDFNRLKHVKDEQGNILSKNEYIYANQN